MENWKLDVAAIVVRLIEEATGSSRWPYDAWEWHRVSTRFGVRWKVVDADILPRPILRTGVLYLPQTCNSELLLRYIVHEMAEAALIWDGEPPYCHPPEDHARHTIACMVEQSFISHLEISR